MTSYKSLKSDQNGIEMDAFVEDVQSDPKLKSDQNGIEIMIAYEGTDAAIISLKSDQNGIEIYCFF